MLSSTGPPLTQTPAITSPTHLVAIFIEFSHIEAESEQIHNTKRCVMTSTSISGGC